MEVSKANCIVAFNNSPAGYTVQKYAPKYKISSGKIKALGRKVLVPQNLFHY